MVRHLGHTQFNLIGLGLFGEYRAQRLGVDIGQLPTADITAVVGVAAGVGVLNSTAPEAVELVESTHRGEPHPVVDLTDFLQ